MVGRGELTVFPKVSVISDMRLQMNPRAVNQAGNRTPRGFPQISDISGVGSKRFGAIPSGWGGAVAADSFASYPGLTSHL